MQELLSFVENRLGAATEDEMAGHIEHGICNSIKIFVPYQNKSAGM
jgi:hypothetical protein